MKRRFALAAVIATTLAGHAGRCLAAETSEELVRRGVEARKSGDDEGALRLMRQAYAEGATAHAAGQLGLCEQALGLWADAESHLIVALRVANDPWVRKYHDVLLQDLDVIRAHLGRLEVHGEPVGARVIVNGKDVGALPLPGPLRVSAGSVSVSIEAPGFTSARGTFRVEADHYENVTLSATRPEDARSAGAEKLPLIATERTSAPPATANGGAWRPRYKWLAWGAGALALAVGVYGSAENLHRVHTFEGAGCSVDNSGNAVNAVGARDAACASKKSDYESASHLAIGAFVGVGVLGAAGLVLWLTEPKAEATRTAWASCQPSLGERLAPGVACTLRF